MADPAAPTTSRPARSGSKAPRTTAASATPPTVSTETENKLARAARSAQRLAELSDVPADDSTLELFPDDPARAALEAMNIDVRQGTLTGFELPDEVLAAVEAAAADEGEAVVVETPVETKAVRRNARAAAKADDAANGGGALEGTGSGVELNAALPEVRVAPVNEAGDAAAATAANANAARTEAETGDDGGKVEASAVAHSSIVPNAPNAPNAQPIASAAGAALPDAQPMTTASAARAASALRQTASGASAEWGGKPDASSARRTPFGASGASGSAGLAGAAAAQSAPPSRATPELDHARAAAFADTVDALYGVIADQRRAAAEHSRRMKRMLSIVVGVLLVTVAIGVAQMLLLVRLTHDTTVQQQRIEQTLLGQQATLATLLQTESSTAPVSVAPAAATAGAGTGGNASANPDAPAAIAPRQPAEPRPSAKTAHAHKHKQAAATATTHTR
jgi:hypothetical protein